MRRGVRKIVTRHKRHPINRGKTSLKPVFFLLFIAVLSAGTLLHSKTVFTSPEVHFSDNSPSGLAIMPASCPSGPVDAQTPYGCDATTGHAICNANGTVSSNDDLSGCPVQTPSGTAGASASCNGSSGQIVLSWNYSIASQALVTLKDPGGTVLVNQNFTNPGSDSVNGLGTGTFTWTVTPSGGSQASGSVFVPNCAPPPSAPVVSCSASPASVQSGATITWTASASGGSGAYSYSWSDTASHSGVTGSNPSFGPNTYTTPGGVSATVIVVDSNGNQASGNCSATVTAAPASAVTATCYPTPATIQPGQPITWNVSASGGSGAYCYSWADTASHMGSTCPGTAWGPITYTTAGTVGVSVYAQDSNNVIGQANCTATVACGSPPPSGKGGNTLAFDVQGANITSNATINSNGYNFCITNSGGNDYFVPARTAGELGSFYDAWHRLSGLTVQ